VVTLQHLSPSDLTLLVDFRFLATQFFIIFFFFLLLQSCFPFLFLPRRARLLARDWDWDTS